MTTLLVLVPTNFELQQLNPLLEKSVAQVGGRMMTCGFGPIASGIRTTQLVARFAPKAVFLVGIAGAIGPQLQVGTAACFSRIACYGIGAGSGSNFLTASELGWEQWSGDQRNQPALDNAPGDVVHLDDSPTINTDNRSMLLTVCAASANAEDVSNRLAKFPQAIAEDMEGFAVALAGRVSGIPVTIVRGISNVAGDRDKRNWKPGEAIYSAAELVKSRIFE